MVSTTAGRLLLLLVHRGRLVQLQTAADVRRRRCVRTRTTGSRWRCGHVAAHDEGDGVAIVAARRVIAVQSIAAVTTVEVYKEARLWRKGGGEGGARRWRQKHMRATYIYVYIYRQI